MDGSVLVDEAKEETTGDAAGCFEDPGRGEGYGGFV